MAMNMTNSQLIGRRVVSQDGHVLGDVSHLVIDSGSWRMVEVGVRLRRDAIEPLGLHKPWIGSQTVRIRVGDIAGVSDALILRPRLDDLRFVDTGSDASPAADDADHPSERA